MYRILKIFETDLSLIEFAACLGVRGVLPLAESFLVLIILAANSSPVCLCTHLFTTENAPLKDHVTSRQVSSTFLLTFPAPP